MTRPMTGKAEVVLEYPDKMFIGTFGRTDRFDARFETNEVLLTLQRGDDAGACRAVRLHLEPQVLADVLRALAGSASATAPSGADSCTLRVAAETLARALAAPSGEQAESKREGAPPGRKDSPDELTPEEEVLLLHVME